MNEDIELYNLFAEAAMLNKQHDPWRQRRKPEMELAIFETVEESEFNFWYNPFVGVRFLGLIHWEDKWYCEKLGRKKMKDIQVVAMVKNVYINKGRNILPQHVIML